MEKSLTQLSLSSLLSARHQVAVNKRLTRRTLNHFPGPRLGTRRGQGLEFDDLRPYFEGDDIRHIDWNVTARANQPYTRLYREEKEQTTTVIVDLRPTMFTGSHKLKSVQASELAACTLWHACQNGDRCAAVVFSVFGVQATRPRGGHHGVINACELINDVFNRARNADSTHNQETSLPSLAHVLSWLQRAGRRTGLKILFSDFDENDDKWHIPLRASAEQRSLAAILITDPLETNIIPQGFYRFKNSASVSAIKLNHSAALRVNEHVQSALQNIKTVFSDMRLPLLECSSECSETDFLLQLVQKQLI